MKQLTEKLNKDRVLSAFMFFFCCVSSFNAQQIRVVNEMFEPLDAVNICNVLETKCVHTGYKGNTDISEYGINDTLVFRLESHKTQKLTVATILNEGRWVIMEPTSNMLSGVQIIAPLRNENGDKGKSTNQTEIISAEELEELNAQTTADVLQNADGVQVQKSQMGGGSPIIRGFEANRVLLVIDGVRLNNAIYRGGHLHNSVTVDNNVLSQVEILYGPGSAVYGSDAIGGVVHFHTKDPKLSEVDSIITGGSGMLRYNSANQEKSGHFDISIGGKKFGSITSVSANDFGDLLSGSKRHHGYDDFGNITVYSQRIDGRDSAIINENPNLQIGTAYKQIDLLQKLIYRHSEKITFKLNTQYSNSTDVPRFDRLNNVEEDGMLEYSEWHYGPQERMFAALKTELSASNFFFSKASFIASAQNISEDRVKRKFGSNSRSRNSENVKVYGLNADLVSVIDSTSQLFYGVELTHNDVISTAFTEDIATGEIGDESTRYPDGGSAMSTGAFYLSYSHTFKKLIAKIGGRYNYNNLKARFIDDSFVALPFESINTTNQALSGNLGLVYLPTKNFKSNFNISTGFRSPNIDDFGKIFKKEDFVVIPNNGITPEYAYSAELGFSKTFQREYHSNGIKTYKVNFLTIGATGFCTVLDNAIIREDYELNGLDSLVYEGENRKIQTNINAEQAIIYGGSGRAKVIFTKNIHLSSSINYTRGYLTNSKYPFAHIPPLFGKTGLLLEMENWDIELFSHYNGWKRKADFAAGTSDNPQEATVDGSPSWYTINFRASLSLNESVTLQFGINNIMDQHYKMFASGISAPGRNIMISGRVFF